MLFRGFFSQGRVLQPLGTKIILSARSTAAFLSTRSALSGDFTSTRFDADSHEQGDGCDAILRTAFWYGGSGFLGSHLFDRLLAEGAEVLCVDNFFTGTRRNIEHLLGSPRFELMRHDVTFSLFVEVDQIYNLACPASPIHYQHDPVQTTKTSVHGAINMLGWPSG